MRQTICDRCGGLITVNGRNDEEMVRVAISLGWYEPTENARWKDYHRRCAKLETVESAYARKGLLPL